MRLAAAALLLASCLTADRCDRCDHQRTKPEMRRETYCLAPIIQPAPVAAPASSTDWIGPVAAAIVAIIGALAGVRYIPSKAFDGPFDKKKA